MAKTTKKKSNAKKTATAVKVRKAAPAAKGGSKYDQPGAPWWKKFSPLEPGKAGI